mgnify:CR=1 FL=1
MAKKHMQPRDAAQCSTDAAEADPTKRAYRAVYGTLRAGFGNHRAYGMDNPAACQKIWEGWLDGFQMWEAGIPFVKQGSGRIWVEVYCFDNLEVLQGVDRLELGAGYHLLPIKLPVCTEIDSNLEPCYLYEYTGPTTRLRPVPSGKYT